MAYPNAPIIWLVVYPLVVLLYHVTCFEIALKKENTMPLSIPYGFLVPYRYGGICLAYIGSWYSTLQTSFEVYPSFPVAKAIRDFAALEGRGLPLSPMCRHYTLL